MSKDLFSFCAVLSSLCDRNLLFTRIWAVISSSFMCEDFSSSNSLSTILISIYKIMIVGRSTDLQADNETIVKILKHRARDLENHALL